MKSAALLATVLELVLAAVAWAEPKPAAVRKPALASAVAAEFFEAKVRPILANYCFSCHSGKKHKGGLRLDSRARLLQGGDDGLVLVPGDPDKSVLIQAVRYRGDLKMPPKKRLPPEAVATLATWVRMGAPWPESTVAKTLPNNAESPQQAWKKHWAWQPVRRPALPAVNDHAWIQSPIDAFILAKLEERGLAPARQADRRTLIRRATFDLIGLPPTPQEIAAFQEDRSPNAFAKVVDRLLASPHYGERWGRYWLDVARYADTKGYVFDQERSFPCAYGYRDYVIRSFNQDLSYDQFVLQQLAADQLPLGNDKRPLAAMGFLTIGSRFMNNKQDIIDDRIDVVTRGLLGLTVSCARCHDHKFDPIPQKDYYSLYGVFASSVEPRALPVITPPERNAAYLAYEKEIQAREQKLEEFLKVKHAELTAGFRARVADYLMAAHQWRHQPNTEDFMFVVQAGDLNPVMVQRWRNFLAARGKEFDPVFAPWSSFAALPAKVFAAEAPNLAARWAANADPKRHMNPLVARMFAGSPPTSLQEVACRYGQLFARIDKLWQQTVRKGDDRTKRRRDREKERRRDGGKDRQGTGPRDAAHLTFSPSLPLSVGTSLPDANDEAIRQVLYGAGAPPNVPLTDIDRFILDRASRMKLHKLRNEIEHYKGTSPAAPPRAMILQDAPVPYHPHVFVRGNPHKLGEAVPRQFLQVLAGLKRRPFQHGSGRLELAQAIASPDNPLAARVMVNRIWLHHFGAGLVRTPSDFGMRSEPPTHPELLDYLAAFFMENGWSVKKMHRLIMLSSVYQQASDAGESSLRKGIASDPENRLLWKMNRQRLDFEATRDALLAAGGHMDLSMGGRPVDLTVQPFSNRRTVYGFIDRQNLPGLFRTFDFPSPDTTSPQRYQTTVPLQALFLLNSPFVVEQARRLAHRPELAAAQQVEAKIQCLYRILYGRPADAAEVELGRRFLQNQATATKPNHKLNPWEKYAQVLLLANEFAFVD